MLCHVLLHVQLHYAHIVWHARAGKLATLCICGTTGMTYGHAIHAN